MLTIELPFYETADADYPAATVTMEHSLVSLSKWEAKYEKPFYSQKKRTDEEAHEFIRTYFLEMILDDEIPPLFVDRLTHQQVVEISEYMNARKSATWFNENAASRNKQQVITSELIYSWMISFKIPFQPTETWHLNRLLTLVRIMGIQNSKQQPMTAEQKNKQAMDMRALNEQRRKELGSAG